jgi:folylpolyglutamate synthase/dihydrofolate synthase
LILPLLFGGVLVAGFLLGMPGTDNGIIPNQWIAWLVGGNSLFANLLASVVGAFMYFASKNVTVAVIEVGLGGRLDATNVVEPVVSVITSISYDHTQLLGNTLAEIAGEKCGIIKNGIPVVSSTQEEEARLVIEQVARERQAPLTQVGQDILFEEPV